MCVSQKWKRHKNSDENENESLFLFSVSSVVVLHRWCKQRINGEKIYLNICSYFWLFKTDRLMYIYSMITYVRKVYIDREEEWLKIIYFNKRIKQNKAEYRSDTCIILSTTFLLLKISFSTKIQHTNIIKKEHKTARREWEWKRLCDKRRQKVPLFTVSMWFSIVRVNVSLWPIVCWKIVNSV